MAWTKGEKVLVAHGAMGGLLTMVILPFGVLAARYLRNYHSKWTRVHYFFNAIIALPMVPTVFALGVYHKLGDDDNWTLAHHRIGIALIVLIPLQILYGTAIHTVAQRIFPVFGRRSWRRYFHVVVGFTVLVLGFVQCYKGINLWFGHLPGGRAPAGCLIAWGVLISVWLVLYLIGLAAVPRQVKKRKEDTGSSQIIHM